jgi:ArsR family transcriptional regulator, arsenate/arsenite/antimonite-responsive transcriptional repressor
VQNSAELFRALADETRLRILNLLGRGEICVCDIMTVLAIGQSKASRHLAYLRNAGLVEDRRVGLWMYYSLAEPKGMTHRRILRWLAEAGAGVPQAAADLKALRALQRGAGRCARNIAGNGQRKMAGNQRPLVAMEKTNE